MQFLLVHILPDQLSSRKRLCLPYLCTMFSFACQFSKTRADKMCSMFAPRCKNPRTEKLMSPARRPHRSALASYSSNCGNGYLERRQSQTSDMNHGTVSLTISQWCHISHSHGRPRFASATPHIVRFKGHGSYLQDFVLRWYLDS